MDKKQAEYYKQASKDFFAPFTEGYRTYLNKDGTTGLTSNLIMDMRCALSYILIAYDYKARIFEKDILHYSSPLENMIKDELPDECINRVRIVDNLLKGYTRMRVPTVYMNKNKAEIENLKQVLLHTDMQTLSTLNYKFGEITVNKQVLIRDIRESIQRSLKTDWLKHVIGAGALGLSVWSGLDTLQGGVLGLIADAGVTALNKINLKEYVPPIEDSRLFTLGTVNQDGMGLFSAERFNYEYEFYNER